MIKTNKRYVITFIITTILMLCILGGLTIVIDPYFHYHKPMKNLSYSLDNQRYQNDGIVKHFEYDAIITGTSMTENFKTSEFNSIFNVNSIKVPFSGASYKEINDNLITATKYNKNIKTILRCLDLYQINTSSTSMRYNKEYYPTHLYDNKPHNDVKYIFNKEILVDTFFTIKNTIYKRNPTSFDDYSKWSQNFNFTKKEVDDRYTRIEKQNSIIEISEKDYFTIKENITKNVINLAKENPEIDFYLYFPPYSIYYWDKLNQRGTLSKEIDTIEYATELMLEYSNIHLYSFINEFEVVCDLNNYKDYEHHSDKINSQILHWIKNKKDLLTKDNYKKYFETTRKFYKNYNYDSLFQ